MSEVGAHSAAAAHSRVRPAMLWRDAAIAAFIAIAILVAHVAAGFPTLHDANGDNDSLLRLVEVHDLIAGQGWFDLHQYRMGPPGGFVMHWSRLVDAPIAGLVIAGTALTGSAAAGDAIALIVWPTMLLALALFLIMRLTQALAGDDASFPAIVIGAVTLRFQGIFNPGAIDHHNVQLVLALAMILSLIRAGSARAALAGLAAAAMLAVGMETAPFVALAGAVVAWLFLSDGGRSAGVAAGFGVGIALGGLAAFFATVPFPAWSEARCDAFSLVQFALAAVGGLGIASASMFFRWNLPSRMSALAIVAAAVAASAFFFFPECIGDPYATVDPLLRRYWLDAVTEAQSLPKILALNPAMAPGFYATAFVALLLSAMRMAKGHATQAEMLMMAFMAMALLVSIWQVRGSMFALPFAVPLLAAFVTRWRAKASAKASIGATAAMLLAWLASFTVSWSAASAGVSLLARELAGETTTAPAMAAGKCQRPEDYAAVAALPPATILASSNLGAPLLRYTGHRVLAGPYHRNNEGNLLALHALMGSPDEAEAIIRAEGVSLVAVCPGNDESRALAEWAPQGLMAALLAGRPPSFLETVSERDDQALVLYRVEPN